jgi:stage II sporulation protein AA (anti-sigma F factor antagonist)
MRPVAMSEPQWKHLACPAVVFAVRVAEIRGDALADELRDELLAAYERSAAVHAVLDLQGVTFLSSAGFRPFLSLQRRVRARGGRLVLCRLGPEVEEVLSVTRLIGAHGSTPAAFTTQPTVPSAVAHLYEGDAAPK